MTKVGKYELVRKLATGGMAEVFLAKFEWAGGLEKTVVVKRILYHLAEDPVFIEMFFGEAQLASQLSHPNICQIIEFGESEAIHFLVMEYIDGPSLRALASAAHDRDEVLPYAVSARIAASACEALAYAHDLTDPTTGQPLQLVHRDVSPDNILISKAGAVKLVDFGIAKAASQGPRTKTGLVKGKLMYMPPEQLRAEPLDRRADIYALGVVLYELVTGARPFDAVSEVSLIHAVLYESIVPVTTRRSDVPLELARIIHKALENDRDRRYPDCRAMHEDLEQFLIAYGEPASAFQIAELVRKYHKTETEPASPRTPSQPVPRTPSQPKLRAGELPTSQVPVQAPALPEASASSLSSGKTVADRPAVSTPSAEPPPAPTQSTVTSARRSAAPPAASAPAIPAPATSEKPKRARFRSTAVIGGIAGVGVILGVAIPLAGYQSRRSGDSQQLQTTGSVGAQSLPVAPTPPPQLPSPASLTVRSTRAGTLRVNGKVMGKTPMQLDDLPSGDVELTVFGNDFLKAEVVQLHPGDNGTKTIVIGRGTIVFRIQPYAVVTLDGQEIGQTPLPPVQVYEGAHMARFSNPALHKTFADEIHVKAGENKIYRLTLK